MTPTQAFAYALTAIKQLDFNYTENNGTVLPGLLSSPNFYGYGKGIGGQLLDSCWVLKQTSEDML